MLFSVEWEVPEALKVVVESEVVVEEFAELCVHVIVTLMALVVHQIRLLVARCSADISERRRGCSVLWSGEPPRRCREKQRKEWPTLVVVTLPGLVVEAVQVVVYHVPKLVVDTVLQLHHLRNLEEVLQPVAPAEP